jgi:hypothetical protein
MQNGVGSRQNGVGPRQNAVSHTPSGCPGHRRLPGRFSADFPLEVNMLTVSILHKINKKIYLIDFV